MNEDMMFSVLGIEKTKEKQAIQNAYRQLLIKTNPEDDPEGFKRLREAYEGAIAYADKPEVFEKQPETPIELWMAQVKDVYVSLSKRLNPQCWEELLKDDLCMDLETSVEARDALLGFLADSFRIKTTIWKLIDKTFNLQEERQELLEKFHPNFIDFVMRQCQSDDDFSFELLEGDDRADYDTFLYHYYELCRQNDSHDFEAAANTLATMAHIPVMHPYLVLERARYDRGAGETAKAAKAAHELLETMGDDLRTLVYSGEIFWDNGEADDAAECFEKVLKEIPTHYMANKYMAMYYQKKEDYEKAKEYCVEALRISANEEVLLDCMRAINLELMRMYEERVSLGTASDDNVMELGWCYLQNEEGGKGVALLEGRTIADKHCAEFHNLLSKCYFVENRFADAVAEAKLCIPAIDREAAAREAEAKEEEKGKQQEKIPGRIAAACEIIAKGLHMLAKEEGKIAEEKDACCQEALEAIEEALKHEPENRNHRIEKAQILMDWGDYRRAYDVCEEMIAADRNDFFAYVLRQKCCFELRNGQGVVDNFYQAKDIYNGYPEIYELAAQVFINYNQYEDSKGILNQAKEAKVSSPKLDVLAITIARETAQTDEERQAVYNQAMDLQQVFKEHAQDVPDENYAELHYETARCLRGIDRNKEALKYIDDACNLKEDKMYRWIRANTLMDLREYKRAILDYEYCVQAYGDNEVVYENTGRCYQNLGNWEKAVECFKKVLEINPENRSANSRIVDIYTERLKASGNLEYYDMGLPHATRQIELDPCAYYYIERGLLYLEAGVWAEAEADFAKAAELEPENTYAYNNQGCVYKYTGRYEEAIRLFEKSIAVMKEKETVIAYSNMADCFERMGQYAKAAEWYKKAKELFPKNRGIRRDLVRVYKKMEQFMDARKEVWDLYGESKGTIPTPSDPQYYLETGEIFLMMGKESKALSLYTQAEKKSEKKNPEICKAMAEVYLYYKNKPKKALELYKEALSLCDKSDSRFLRYCRSVMECLNELGRQEEAYSYKQMALESIEEIYGSLEAYLNHLYWQAEHRYTVGALYFYAGEKEKAKEYFDNILCNGMCRHCSYPVCEDYWEAQGFLHEAEGQLEEALACYEKACEHQKDNHLSKYRAAKLKKKLRKR